MEEKQQKDLVAAAVKAKAKAYAKYSNFPVGAALLCRDGTVVTGIAWWMCVLATATVKLLFL